MSQYLERLNQKGVGLNITATTNASHSSGQVAGVMLFSPMRLKENQNA